MGKFEVGDLVVLNQKGRKLFEYRRAFEKRRIGVVTGKSRKLSWVVYVKWDGLIHPEELAEDFLDYADPNLDYEETLRKIAGPSIRRALKRRLNRRLKLMEV